MMQVALAALFGGVGLWQRNDSLSHDYRVTTETRVQYPAEIKYLLDTRSQTFCLPYDLPNQH